MKTINKEKLINTMKERLDDLNNKIKQKYESELINQLMKKRFIELEKWFNMIKNGEFDNENYKLRDEK